MPLVQEEIAEDVETFITLKRKQMMRNLIILRRKITALGIRISHQKAIMDHNQDVTIEEQMNIKKAMKDVTAKFLKKKRNEFLVNTKNMTIYDLFFDSYGSILNFEKDVG